MPSPRRLLLAALALAALACAHPPQATPPAPLAFRLGYSTEAWGTADLLGISDIAALGYDGVQVRLNTWQHFSRAPQVFEQLLAPKHLAFVGLASGALGIDGRDDAQLLGELLTHARFVRDAKGSILEVTDAGVGERAVTGEDCGKLGDLLTRVGAQLAPFGITLAYSPRLGSIGGTAERLAAVLAASDSTVRLSLDVAHVTQAGDDPAALLRRHAARLAMVRLQDVTPSTAAPGFRFVELGRGRVSFASVFAALRDVGFHGWVVVTLEPADALERPAGESARISRDYLASRGLWSGA